MALDTNDTLKSIVAAFRALPTTSPEKPLSNFLTEVLSLNPSQIATLLPDQAASPNDKRFITLGKIAGKLESVRKEIIEAETRIPSAVLYSRRNLAGTADEYFVAGLSDFVLKAFGDLQYAKRVEQTERLREYLLKISDPGILESLAAALLSGEYPNCLPTQKTRDQGVDCLASRAILELESWCCAPDKSPTVSTVGESLHVIASCKAMDGSVSNTVSSNLLPPAHIRELVGGWLIQRTDSGMWQRLQGIKPLAPVQLLLVTTYRLSDPSLKLCRQIGVSAWGVPQLIARICKSAPETVFPKAHGFAFQPAAMELWHSAFGITRMKSPPNSI